MMENTCYLLGIDMFQHIAKGYPCWGYDLFMILPLLFVTVIVFYWVFILAQMFIQKDENVRKIPLKKWISLIVLTVFCFLLIAFEVTVIKVKHDKVFKELRPQEKEEHEKMMPIDCHWECLYTDRYIYVYTELL